SNMSVFGMFDVIRVFKETADVYHGTACARIETQDQMIITTTYTVPGMISFARVGFDFVGFVPTYVGGIATTNRPEKFRGYYKYTPGGSDSCVIYVTVTKWNTGLNMQDTIGQAMLKSGSVPNWTLFEIPINYNTGDVPDSCNVFFSSSDDANMADGSILRVDSVSFTGSVPVGKISASRESDIYIYPNPATDQLSINFSLHQPYSAEIKLYNAIGKVVYSKSITNAKQHFTKLDVSSLPAGLYFVEVVNGSNRNVKKVVIK
ncbi:MAG: T9SS type A sorting domain-containing protein, partial [Bacteroidota bacterium]